MVVSTHIAFGVDLSTARSVWQAEKNRNQRINWLACSKLKGKSIPDLDEGDGCFIYQDLSLDLFLAILAPLLNRVMWPLLQARKPFYFYSQIPHSDYHLELSSEQLHENYTRLSQLVLLEQFCQLLDGPLRVVTKISKKASTLLVLDSDLDEAQQRAIGQIYGPVRVLAPAGSGKTKTLINRIIHLVNEGVAPRHILALAFNKKAAQEMVQRLTLRGLPVARHLEERGVTVRTFHGLGYEILRRQTGWCYHEDVGDKKCRELLLAAAETVLKLPILRNQDPAAGLLTSLSQAKNDLLGWEEMRTEISGELYPFKEIFLRYLHLQTLQRFMNFDDMIYWPLRWLLQSAELRGKLQHRFHFVLVDEFQDLNRSQLLLMQLLNLPHNNLFVVGDDDQMIYGWRGADVQNILKFAEYYGSNATHTLETNYRSTRKIITHSKWLIGHNRQRVHKDVRPAPGARHGEFCIELQDSLWAQAKKAVEWMMQRKEAQACDWSQFAVLYRYHVFQHLVAVLLDGYQIPHTPVPEAGLLQTAVGRDLYSYLTVFFFPERATGQDWSRVLKRPNKFLTNSLIRTISSWESLEECLLQEGGAERERLILADWVRQAQSVRTLDPSQMTVPELLHRLTETFSLRPFYQNQRAVYAAVDEAGQEIVLDVILEVSAASPSLSAFHEALRRAQQNERTFNLPAPSLASGVTLSTIHAGKGREFPHVVLFNLAMNSHDHSATELEEERRVAYVGVTRAISGLLITAPEEAYADFLLEVALNPEFAKLTNSSLAKRIKQARNKLQRLPTKGVPFSSLLSKPGRTGQLDKEALQEKLDELEEEQRLRQILTLTERDR